jgi:hypothetical protein
MRRPPVHSLIAWLCLFSFGMDMAMHAIGPVVCASASGERLEWACEKDEQSACLRENVEQNLTDYHPQNGMPPCEDRPVGGDHDQTHHLLTQPRQGGHADFTLPPATFAVLPSFSCDPVIRSGPSWADLRVRPPDAVARLRTVILIV